MGGEVYLVFTPEMSDSQSKTMKVCKNEKDMTPC